MRTRKHQLRIVFVFVLEPLIGHHGEIDQDHIRPTAL